jgi:hypothetical protein
VLLAAAAWLAVGAVACAGRGGSGGAATGSDEAATSTSAGAGTRTKSASPDAPPAAAECKALYDAYRAAAPPDAPADEVGFVARCRASDRGVLGCLDEAEKACAAAPGAGRAGPGGLCVASGAAACVQRHRTLAARKEGIPERLAHAIIDGAITPDPSGGLALSGDFATAAFAEKAYAVKLAHRRALVFFPIWRGRCRNVRGYVWSSAPFTGADFAKGTGADETLPVLALRLEDPCAAPPPAPSVPSAAGKSGKSAKAPAAAEEPFVVDEHVDPNWLAVSWTWD